MRYHPFYCEENVFHLCHDPLLAGRPLDVVFISNPSRTVRMWHQRAGRGGPIVWDYHVVVIARDAAEVWDLDSELGYPISLREYVRATFGDAPPRELEPWFRVVDAAEFTFAFASDRSHMRRPGGLYLQPPPPWEPIGGAGAASNLMRFVDVSQPYLGEVRRLGEMLGPSVSE